MNLTDQSKKLFVSLVEDAPNWSGTPIVEVSREDRGNLTQLKRAGLLTTDTDDGVVFAWFTTKGIQYAVEIDAPFADKLHRYY